MAGNITIQVSEDGFQATVAAIQSRTKIEDVVSALQAEGVVHGIRSSGINLAIEEANSSGKPVQDVVVAEGNRPDYTAPPSLEHHPRGEDGELPSLKSLKSLMLQKTPEEIEAAATEATALFVKSGDLLAVKSVGEVTPGKNVKGEVVEKLAGEEEKYPHFQPGPGVKLLQETEYRAAINGYAGIMDG